MGREALVMCYAFVGVFLLITLGLIRVRLKKSHPDMFTELGSPDFGESNLRKAYWTFQKFVWWGHKSRATDTVLRSLCIVACLSEVAVVVLFFYLILL